MNGLTPFFPPGTGAVTLGGAARRGLAAQRLLLEHPPPAPNINPLDIDDNNNARVCKLPPDCSWQLSKVEREPRA